MGLFSVGLRLHSMAYLGFADGLFGLHYLRFNLRMVDRKKRYPGESCLGAV